jgi:hypothetical protein
VNISVHAVFFNPPEGRFVLCLNTFGILHLLVYTFKEPHAGAKKENEEKLWQFQILLNAVNPNS